MLMEEAINRTSFSDPLQLFGNGWQRILNARKTGSGVDINIISPEGRRFTQYSGLAKYLNMTQNKVLNE